MFQIEKPCKMRNMSTWNVYTLNITALSCQLTLHENKKLR